MSPHLRLVLSICFFIFVFLGKATAQEPLLQIVSVTKQDVSCHGGNDGEITIEVSGGNSPIIYTLFRLSPSPNWFDVIETTDEIVTFPGSIPITAGTYIVAADDGVTSVNEQIDVNQPPAINAGITPNPAQACSGSDLQLHGNPNGGQGSYTHLWSGTGAAHLNSTSIVNPVFNSMTGGDFDLTYRVTDESGCFAQSNATISNTDSPTTDAGTGGNACGNSFTLNATNSFGTGTWTASGPGTATFDNVNDPNTAVAVSDLGSYIFTWTETNDGCSDSDDVSVNFFPQASLSHTTTHPSTSVSTDGSIEAVVSGGTSPFNFILTDSSNNETSSGFTGASSFLFENLTEGEYTLEVIDNNGCNDLIMVILSSSPILTVDVQTFPSCTGNDGSINIDILSGQAPFTVTVTQVPGGDVLNTTSSDLNYTVSDLMEGDYEITIQDDASNVFNTTVSVGAGVTASISYDGSPFCGDGTATVTQTGQGGGTYSATPAGLAIDPNTGTIDLGASTSGTYTVTYDFTDGTCSGSTQTQVEIGDMDSVSISYEEDPYCAEGTAVVTITGLQMDYTERTFSSGHIPTDGLFDLEQDYSRCPGEMVVTIPTGAVITGVDVQYNMTAHSSTNFWISDQRSQLRVVSPGGINEPEVTEGPEDLIFPGTHTYLRTDLDIANGVVGGGDIQFELHAGRVRSFASNSDCATNRQRVDNNTWRVRVYHTAVNLFYAEPAGLVIDPITGEVDLEASVPGTYTVYYDYGDGTCTGTTSTQITVNPFPVATISYDDSPYCTEGTATVTRTGQEGGTYTSDAGLEINSATGEINLENSEPGLYIITYTFALGDCINSTTAEVEINAQPEATISYAEPVYCAEGTASVTLTGQTGGAYTANPAGLSINTDTGEINLGASDPGEYVITYTFSDGVCENTTTTTVEVISTPTATIFYDEPEFCAFGTATVTRTGQDGGTYTSDAGLAINETTGDINLEASEPGFYTVTYSFSDGTCSSFTTTEVTILALPQATIAYLGSPYCASGTATVTLTGQTGGTFDATPAGLDIDPITGTIDLSVSLANTYTVYYRFDDGNCENVTSTTVTITSLPEATISYDDSPYCALGLAEVNLTGQSGGTFSSTSGLVINSNTGQIDLEASIPDTYTVTYTFSSDGCENQTNAEVTINALPIASISYPDSPYCPEGTVLVERTGQAGGTYSSTTGLAINPLTGEVDLETSDAGTYTVTYSFSDGTCDNTATTEIIIRELPTATISYPDTPYCAEGVADVTITGQQGGTFSSTAGLIINPSTGQIDLEASTPGNYIVTYNFDDGVCTNETTTVIDINPLPVASISYDEDYYCAFGFADVTLTGQTGGTFSSTEGLVIDPDTGDIDLELSISGTYIVTYEFSDGICTSFTTAEFSLRALPQAEIAYEGSPYCTGGLAMVTQTGETGGIYNASPVGLSLELTTGTINLDTSIPGTYTVFYRFDDGFCENITTTTVVINEAPLLLLENYTDASCANEDSGTITVQAIGGQLPYTFELLDADAATVLQSFESATSDPFTFTNVPYGLYYVTVNDGNICSSSVIGPVFIDEPDPITIDPASLEFTEFICEETNEAFISISANGGTGNLYYTLLQNGSPVQGPQEQDGMFENLEPGTYIVSITDDLNCGPIESELIIIEQADLPIANIEASDSEICEGELITLTASGGTSYEWIADPVFDFEGNENNTQLEILLEQTTTFYLHATNVCGSDMAQITITVSAAPVVDLGDDISVCEGEEVILDAGSYTEEVSYLWSDESTGQTLEVSTTGSYSVMVTNTATQCSSFDEIIVVFNELPPAFTGPDTLICEGSSIELGSSEFFPGPVSTYLWTSEPYDESLEEFSTISNPVVSPVTTTTYTLTETFDGGCSNSNSVVVQVLRDFAEAGQDTTICPGITITLGPEQVMEGYLYNWISSNENEEFESNTANPLVTPITTTTYTLEVTHAELGCIDTHSVEITVHALPMADVGESSNIDICLGEQVTLGATNFLPTPPNSYLWISEPEDATLVNDTVSNPTVSPLVTTTYTLIETYTNTGCTNQNSVTVSVHNFPVVEVTNSTNVCENEAIHIGNDNNPENYSYLWTSIPEGFISTSSNPLILVNELLLDNNNQITFHVEVSSAYCSSENQVTLTVDPEPVVDIISDSGYCSADEIQDLEIGGDAIPNHTYMWESDQEEGIFSTESNPMVNPTVTTIYTLTVTNTVNGCSASESVEIAISDFGFTAFSNPAICEGETSAALGEYIILQGGITPYQYFWADSDGNNNYPNELNPIVSEPFADYYILRAIDAMNCPISDTLQIDITDNPEVFLAVNNDTLIGNVTIYPGQTLTFQAIPADYDYYEFYIIDVPDPQDDIEETEDLETKSAASQPGTLVQSGSSSTYTATNLINGQKIYVVVYDSGCAGQSESIGIIVNELPNAFTPDGDGINDIFAEGLEITIFNRWGQKVYKGARGSTGWDGNFNGRKVSPGTYYYLLNLYDENNSKTTLKGSVTVILSDFN